MRQRGIITDGDGSYSPEVDDCTWIIAPPGATKIYVVFTALTPGGPSKEEEQIEIMACTDKECTSAQHVPGSPFTPQSPGMGWYCLHIAFCRTI